MPTTRLLVQPAAIQVRTLRDYQLEGVNWLIGLHEHGVNGILADEMGLGKTIQTISLLAWVYESAASDAVRAAPTIVLVPKTTLSNWEREFREFCPSLKTCVLIGDKDERAALIDERLRPGLTPAQRDWQVLLTTYEIANIESAALSRLPYLYLVVDEAHRLKNEQSVRV